MSDERRRWLKAGAYATAALVLAAVFAAYLNPHLVVDLASRVWACF
jgi:hypothetical protein